MYNACTAANKTKPPVKLSKKHQACQRRVPYACSQLKFKHLFEQKIPLQVDFVLSIKQQVNCSATVSS